MLTTGFIFWVLNFSSLIIIVISIVLQENRIHLMFLSVTHFVVAFLLLTLGLHNYTSRQTSQPSFSTKIEMDMEMGKLSHTMCRIYNNHKKFWAASPEYSSMTFFSSHAEPCSCLQINLNKKISVTWIKTRQYILSDI